MADTQRKIGPPFSAIAILLRILAKTIEHTDLKPSQSCLYCLKSFESTVGAGYGRVRFIVDRCHPPSRHYFPQVPNVRTTEVAQSAVGAEFLFVGLLCSTTMSVGISRSEVIRLYNWWVFLIHTIPHNWSEVYNKIQQILIFVINYMFDLRFFWYMRNCNMFKTSI
jgi:hypothetical protein